MNDKVGRSKSCHWASSTIDGSILVSYEPRLLNTGGVYFVGIMLAPLDTRIHWGETLPRSIQVTR